MSRSTELRSVASAVVNATRALLPDLREIERLMANDALEFGFRRSHREAFEVHGRLILVDLQDLGADIRPVACLVFGRVKPRNADLSDAGGLGKFHVGLLSPGVHVQQDALS